MAPDLRLAEILAADDLDLSTDAGHWTHVSKFRYADSLLSGEGAKLSSGRFHQKADYPALYFAQSPVTALFEVGMLLGTQCDFVVRRSEPHMLVIVDLAIPSAVLDMTHEDNHLLFETGHQELTGEWLLDAAPATQRLGKAAYESGRVVAIRYPSARRRGSQVEPNLIVFRDRLCALRGAVMRAYDPKNDLPGTVEHIGKRLRRKRKR
ncbi:MAG TPA: RES family NAD+ phosphorylase [Candidatus Elarobacter sp.]